MTVRFDYDSDPHRYRLGMRVAGDYARADLYRLVAGWLTELNARDVLDVGCGEGALRAAVPGAGLRLIGLDASATMLRAHPPPTVRADAAHLPFAAGVFDVATALNVLYHLSDPLPALREARRVLRADGYLIVSAIARDDSPELRGYWVRPRTSFDAEDAPALLGQVFEAVSVYRWDAPLVTLPDRASVRDYLIGRQAPAEVAERAGREVRLPLTVTKRGALIRARRRAGDV